MAFMYFSFETPVSSGFTCVIEENLSASNYSPVNHVNEHSNLIAVMFLSISLWVGLLLSDVKAGKHRFWFYGFAAVYTFMACLFIRMTLASPSFSSGCGTQVLPSISPENAFLSGGILAAISGIGVLLLFGAHYFLMPKFKLAWSALKEAAAASIRRHGKVKPVLTALLIGGVGLTGYQLYQTDQANRKTLQSTTDMVVLRTIVNNRDWWEEPDLLDKLRGDAQIILAEHNPAFTLQNLILDQDSIVSATLTAEQPIIKAVGWNRDYETSAHAPLPMPFCDELEGKDIKVKCTSERYGPPIAR